MKRIATPMIGGVITSTLMELLVYPAIFFAWRSRSLNPPSTLYATSETVATTPR